MNKISVIRKILIIIIIPLLFLLGACDYHYVRIKNGSSVDMIVGEKLQLSYQAVSSLDGYDVIWSSDNDCVTVDDYGLVTANKIGKAYVKLSISTYYKTIMINVIEKEEKLVLSSSNSKLIIGESIELTCSLSSNEEENNFEYEIISGNEYASLDGNILTGISKGLVKVEATHGSIKSNTIEIEVIEENKIESIELRATKYYLSSGEISTLIASKYPSTAEGNITYEITKGKEYISFSETNQITAGSNAGIATIVAKCGNIVSNEIEITTVIGSGNPTSITLIPDKQICSIGDYVTIDYIVSPTSAAKNIEFIFSYGEENAYIIGNKLYITNDEQISIIGKIGNVYSNEILINSSSIEEDPYENMSEQEFYSNYTPASSYTDAYYRSLHGFMSGSIEEQDQEPTISENRPMQEGYYLRNSNANYSVDGNTYYIVNENGRIVNQVYKGGAYVILEEVAAYIFAFGDVPVNYSESRSTDPDDTIWGKYLRLNNSYFSGDISRYPYEPALPNIRGNDGELYYYEVDIGTTGTDCDPKYPAVNYNNGSSISRGAARIVYTRYDENENEIIDINEKYLFYTYNHYNDFQEYLNYYGGWGEMFGNITGGGTISSSSDYNPTEYVKTILKDFVNDSGIVNQVFNQYFYLPEKKYVIQNI